MYNNATLKPQLQSVKGGVRVSINCPTNMPNYFQSCSSTVSFNFSQTISSRTKVVEEAFIITADSRDSVIKIVDIITGKLSNAIRGPESPDTNQQPLMHQQRYWLDGEGSQLAFFITTPMYCGLIITHMFSFLPRFFSKNLV